MQGPLICNQRLSKHIQVPQQPRYQFTRTLCTPPHYQMQQPQLWIHNIILIKVSSIHVSVNHPPPPIRINLPVIELEHSMDSVYLNRPWFYTCP